MYSPVGIIFYLYCVFEIVFKLLCTYMHKLSYYTRYHFHKWEIMNLIN